MTNGDQPGGTAGDDGNGVRAEAETRSAERRPHGSPLDVTDACPLGGTCAVCGSTDRLRATTYNGEIGVYCRTVCADCIVGGRRPQLTPGSENLAIVAHCDHLGIDTDEMVRRHYNEGALDRFYEHARTSYGWSLDVPLDDIQAAVEQRQQEISGCEEISLSPPRNPDWLRSYYEGTTSERTPGQWRRRIYGSLTERKILRERAPEVWKRLYEGSDRTPDPDKGA